MKTMTRSYMGIQHSLARALLSQTRGSQHVTALRSTQVAQQGCESQPHQQTRPHCTAARGTIDVDYKGVGHGHDMVCNTPARVV